MRLVPNADADITASTWHRTRRRDWSGYAFLTPYLVLFVGFLVIPLLFGLCLSFTKYDMLTREPARFIAFGNYLEAFADPKFINAMRVTALFVLMVVPLTVGLALLLAVGLEALPTRPQNACRLAIFVPTMITISVAGILWRWFYDTEFGVFNSYLAHVGVKAPWLSSKYLALPSIVLMTVWWTVGGPTVILQAGLKQIPNAYYEAAAIDGATGWRRFWFITLPLLRPVLLFVLVLNVIGAFQIFGQPFIMTTPPGGPEDSTRVAVMYIYQNAFNFYRMGYGSAMSWLLFCVIVVFSAIQFRVLREQ
jgi:multiple sugar transport system permease protein